MEGGGPEAGRGCSWGRGRRENGEGAEPPGAAGAEDPCGLGEVFLWSSNLSFLTGLLPAVSRFEKFKISCL